TSTVSYISTQQYAAYRSKRRACHLSVNFMGSTSEIDLQALLILRGQAIIPTSYHSRQKIPDL
ncbi:hypothetical protein, partial [Dyadobacter sp. BHUBP1]|uniref:hypothetical protein n=1 Tax=Dyadobacter sp. BHUBP1 TaxID=3424178 RepID=UPI003D34CD76